MSERSGRDSSLEGYHRRLEEHEAIRSEAREQLEELDTAASGQSSAQVSTRALAGGSALAALGLAGAGTASADPTGQVGSEDRPVETVYIAALAGPLTDGEELDSLVGDGLAIEDGVLALAESD